MLHQHLRELPATPGCFPGPRLTVTSRTSFAFDQQRIIVADEESAATAFIVDTLRRDGHCVTQATDAWSATSDCELRDCHLFIIGAGIDSVPSIELIQQLRDRLPALAILCLAGRVRSTTALEARLPPGVPILREPFTAEKLRAAVQTLLPQLRMGSVFASRPAVPTLLSGS